jgi:hypothetical protein
MYSTQKRLSPGQSCTPAPRTNPVCGKPLHKLWMPVQKLK